MTSFRLSQLAVGYARGAVLDGIDLELPDGGTTAIIGVNGSGKSTLLKTIARILRPARGAVLLDGRDIHRLPTREVARSLAILAQNPPVPAGLTVRDLVSYGRSPHQRGLRRAGPADARIIDWAMAETGVADLASQPVDQLSGGQRQRAWIAMAVAQDAPVILLDEPTTFLDIAHQIEILELLGRLTREAGRTVVMVVHDINHALAHADHVLVLDQGRGAAAGPPGKVITADLIRDVFHVHAHVAARPGTNQLHCVPYALVSDHGGTPLTGPRSQ
jgi:iron complex transport system ATP-binding protein